MRAAAAPFRFAERREAAERATRIVISQFDATSKDLQQSRSAADLLSRLAAQWVRVLRSPALVAVSRLLVSAYFLNEAFDSWSQYRWLQSPGLRDQVEALPEAYPGAQFPLLHLSLVPVAVLCTLGIQAPWMAAAFALAMLFQDVAEIRSTWLRLWHYGGSPPDGRSGFRCVQQSTATIPRHPPERAGPQAACGARVQSGSPGPGPAGEPA